MDSSVSSVPDVRPQGFRFLDLPAELRRHTLELALLVDRTVDLDPANCRRIAPRLELSSPLRKSMMKHTLSSTAVIRSVCFRHMGASVAIEFGLSFHGCHLAIAQLSRRLSCA
jgi:hypothetical protein